VNHAAGIGDSRFEISRVELVTTRTAALARILKILTVFAGQGR
jgi:hypothetical protein